MLTFRQFSLVEEVMRPADSLGMSREEMPQVASADVPALLAFLKSHHVLATREEVLASSLKPTQKEINTERVQAMTSACSTEEKPMLVSKDGFILDGHHRWMRAVWDKKTLHIIRLDRNILAVLELVKQFPKAFFIDIKQRAAAA
jgi:hypothetical protein